MTLPRSLDELAGLRAARWIRESTSGQFDAFGPDAQREQQDRAIERWGLVDVGLAWQVAHSGRTVGSTPQFAEMMAAAGVEYDVLVVGYVSRFARDVRTAVNARHDLHAAGAAILFADERILTSDDDAWDSWAREAVEAESYSRKLARRIREGYAAKRHRLGEPGGRPPFGFVRRGRPPRLEPDERLVLVRECFARGASGQPDRAIAAGVALPLDTVRGILTNPIYVGRLRDGTAAAVQTVIDEATWETVQRRRRARRTRAGRPATRQVYALPMLRCAACGRRLIGDSGRYRHRDPCAAFTTARRRRAWKNQLVRTPGNSYPARFYEDLVPYALDAMALQTRDLVAGAAWYAEQQPVPDPLALRRVTAERDRALSRYSRDRDVAALERRMAELDAEEAAIRTDVGTVSAPDWSEVVELVRELPALWSDADARPEDRRALAVASFESVDALGARRLAFTMAPPAGGVQVVVVVGARGIVAAVTVHWPPSFLAGVERTFGTGG
jgi:DNA invertase Pin-like site-specific DNA recombinase